MNLYSCVNDPLRPLHNQIRPSPASLALILAVAGVSCLGPAAFGRRDSWRGMDRPKKNAPRQFVEGWHEWPGAILWSSAVCEWHTASRWGWQPRSYRL